MRSLEPILVLTTGGTIDKQYFDALSEFTIVDSMVERLLSTARVTHPFEIREVLRKDSILLNDEDRLCIRRHIAESPCQKVVITHGTDTMTHTASALEGFAGKTIVLTGALSPARFSESDAAFNVGMAFACAQLAPPSVYIAMNGIVFRAREVRKSRKDNQFVPIGPAECT